MKLLFLCSSLEPGRDGVGDYTRRIAIALRDLGVSSQVVALNDPHINLTSEEIQTCSDGEIPVTRFPSKLSWPAREATVRAIADQQQPDWVSLQFVPYGFHRKGLPLHLPRAISSMFPSRLKHIMFHELWVGTRSKVDFRHAVIRTIQRRIVRHLVQNVHCVHTHLPEFLRELTLLGVHPKPLPLPANISFKATSPSNSSKALRLAVFSQTSCPSEISEFLSDFNRDCQARGKKLELHICGFANSEVRQQWEGSVRDVPITFHGWMEESKIADLLSSCDAGVTPVPRHALGKSGTVAAFIAAGLPVVAPVKGKPFDPFVHKELASCIIDEPTVDLVQQRTKHISTIKHYLSPASVATAMKLDLCNSLFTGTRTQTPT